jgi:23S rRNA pseudouridine1911/1915/1917 synthase
MELQVLHADNHVLAVVKPAGMPAVPDASGDASLFDLARAYVERVYEKPGRAFLGVVQRLDRPVSGVVIFARTSKAAARLSAAFAGRAVEKHYVGVGLGRLDADAGEIEQWLWKDREHNRVHVRAMGSAGAKRARTRWRVRARAPGRVLLELLPETGRAHQLRLACASLGMPLAGDLRYGAPVALGDRSIALHAERLVCPHPVLETPLVLVAPRPGSAPRSARATALPPDVAAVWSFPSESGEPR